MNLIFLGPYPPLNLEADVTSTDITVQWEYDTRNSDRSPIMEYGLMYKEDGGTWRTENMKMSDIINNTGSPIILSYTLQNFLKPFTNYTIKIQNNNQYTSYESNKLRIETTSAGISIYFFLGLLSNDDQNWY